MFADQFAHFDQREVAMSLEMGELATIWLALLDRRAILVEGSRNGNIALVSAQRQIAYIDRLVGYVDQQQRENA